MRPAPDVNDLGLVAHWGFDVGTGSVLAKNSTGLGNNGLLQNMDPATDWVAGKIGGALDFDGTDDGLICPTPR